MKVLTQVTPAQEHADTLRIPLSQIRGNPRSLRHKFVAEQLDELAGSIKDQGLLQPLVIRMLPPEETPTATPRFEVVIGERRYIALLRAGYDEAACVVKDWSSEDALINSYADYAQHEALSEAEDARFLQMLYFDRGMSVRDIAARIHKSLTYVSRRITVSKDPVLQRAVDEGRIGQGAAQELIRAPVDRRAELLEKAVGATADEVRQMVNDRVDIEETRGKAISEEDVAARNTRAGDRAYLGSSGTASPPQPRPSGHDPMRRPGPVTLIPPPPTLTLVRQIREWVSHLPVGWTPNDQEVTKLDEAIHLLASVRGRHDESSNKRDETAS